MPLEPHRSEACRSCQPMHVLSFGEGRKCVFVLYIYIYMYTCATHHSPVACKLPYVGGNFELRVQAHHVARGYTHSPRCRGTHGVCMYTGTRDACVWARAFFPVPIPSPPDTHAQRRAPGVRPKRRQTHAHHTPRLHTTGYYTRTHTHTRTPWGV